MFYTGDEGLKQQQLYVRIYAEESGRTYDPEDAGLLRKASEKYPLPFSLDYRMH